MCNEKDETAQYIVSERKKLVQLWYEHKRRHDNIATFVKKKKCKKLVGKVTSWCKYQSVDDIGQWQLEEHV